MVYTEPSIDLELISQIYNDRTLPEAVWNGVKPREECDDIIDQAIQDDSVGMKPFTKETYDKFVEALQGMSEGARPSEALAIIRSCRDAEKYSDKYLLSRVGDSFVYDVPDVGPQAFTKKRGKWIVPAHLLRASLLSSVRRHGLHRRDGCVSRSYIARYIGAKMKAGGFKVNTDRILQYFAEHEDDAIDSYEDYDDGEEEDEDGASSSDDEEDEGFTASDDDEDGMGVNNNEDGMGNNNNEDGMGVNNNEDGVTANNNDDEGDENVVAPETVANNQPSGNIVTAQRRQRDNDSNHEEDQPPTKKQRSLFMSNDKVQLATACVATACVFSLYFLVEIVKLQKKIIELSSAEKSGS